MYRKDPPIGSLLYCKPWPRLDFQTHVDTHHQHSFSLELFSTVTAARPPFADFEAAASGGRGYMLRGRRLLLRGALFPFGILVGFELVCGFRGAYWATWCLDLALVLPGPGRQAAREAERPRAVTQDCRQLWASVSKFPNPSPRCLCSQAHHDAKAVRTL